MSIQSNFQNVIFFSKWLKGRFHALVVRVLITCDPSRCTIDHSKFIVSNQKDDTMYTKVNTDKTVAREPKIV